MFRLKLDIVHTVLVWKEPFETREAAETFAQTLPGRFDVIEEKDLPSTFDEIPVKDEKPCQNQSST